MFELHGKYGSAKVFTDNCEQDAISQIMGFLNNRAAEGQRIRIMPDVHAGKGCTIGTTMTITDKVIPNLVGVDIGCGLFVVPLGKEKLDLDKVDRIIRECIPCGFSIRETPHSCSDGIYLEELHCYEHIGVGRALNSIGTLGGGNHFIEIDKDDEGCFYLVIHSGSRHLGVEIAKHYQQKAYEENKRKDVKELVERYRKQGRERELKEVISKFHKENKVNKDLAYCEGDLFRRYMQDMAIAQEYANLNRFAIADEILTELNMVCCGESFSTVHNYIDHGSMILRKGAVSAKKGEKLIIPMNMRDGSLICLGKGNPDWNFSAPHGAGRLMSRSKAKDSIALEDFKESMKGIYSTSVCSSTIDESPMAYKPMEEIMDNIKDTVEVVKVIKPVYNFKAS